MSNVLSNLVRTLNSLEHLLARLGVVDQRIAHRAVHELEVLRAGLAVDGLFGRRHLEGMSVGMRRGVVVPE